MFGQYREGRKRIFATLAGLLAIGGSLYRYGMLLKMTETELTTPNKYTVELTHFSEVRNKIEISSAKVHVYAYNQPEAERRALRSVLINYTVTDCYPFGHPDIEMEK